MDKRSPTEGDKSWRGHGTILVVDDEAVVRSVLVRILSKLGFDVLTARDGQERVDVFRERSDEIRAVMMDLTMPRMSGKVAILEMNRIDPATPVLLMSGYAEEEAVADPTVKMAGFLHKPFEVPDIVTALRGALEH